MTLGQCLGNSGCFGSLCSYPHGSLNEQSDLWLPFRGDTFPCGYHRVDFVMGGVYKGQGRNQHKLLTCAY